MHVSSALSHTVMRLSRACLNMFLCFLNKSALNAATMSEAINAKTVVFL